MGTRNESMETYETTALVNRGTTTTANSFWQRQRFCVRPNVVFLILLWNVLVGLSGCGIVLNPGGWYLALPLGSTLNIVALVFGIIASLLLLSPLTTFCADVYFGTYKVVVFSVLMISLLPFTGIFSLFAFLFYVAFNANIIQLGVHQLYDPLSESLPIFIHWFVWTQYLAVSVSRLLWSIFVCNDYSGTYNLTGIILGLTTPFLCFIALGATSCVGWYRRAWFLQKTTENPYRLIYKILKHVLTKCSHRNLSYPENERPSKLDLAKEQYGGPFTNDKVEDVKTFFRILLVLATISSVFNTELATDGLLPVLGMHIQDWTLFSQTPSCRPAENILLNSGVLAPMIIVILIPLYMFIRPIICCVPGKLKRIGLGMFVMLLSLVASLFIDTAGHIQSSDTTCMLTVDYTNQTNEHHPLNIDSIYLIIPNVLNAVGLMLVYIASYEFICAQSPHSMKGVLIGTFFAIKGLSQLLGVVLIIPFMYWKPQFPSCGFGYYLVNIVIALTGIVMYTMVARGYYYQYIYVERQRTTDVDPVQP